MKKIETRPAETIRHPARNARTKAPQHGGRPHLGMMSVIGSDGKERFYEASDITSIEPYTKGEYVFVPHEDSTKAIVHLGDKITPSSEDPTTLAKRYNYMVQGLML